MEKIEEEYKQINLERLQTILGEVEYLEILLMSEAESSNQIMAIKTLFGQVVNFTKAFIDKKTKEVYNENKEASSNE